MGNTRAWPVLRTTDLAEALSLAEKLLSVASWYDPTGCYLQAWADTEDDLRRLTEALPESEVSWHEKDGVRLPTCLSLDVGSFAQARRAVESWADIGRFFVNWHHMKWPPVPELGLDEEYKYAELEIACHSHDIHCERWTPEHTVFVHARPGDEARPAWLAAQAGSRVVGPAEFGW